MPSFQEQANGDETVLGNLFFVELWWCKSLVVWGGSEQGAGWVGSCSKAGEGGSQQLLYMLNMSTEIS